MILSSRIPGDDEQGASPTNGPPGWIRTSDLRGTIPGALGPLSQAPLPLSYEGLD